MSAMKDLMYGGGIDRDTAKHGFCNLCGAKYENFGNNGEPCVSGRVCDSCNALCVIPARIDNIKKGRERDYRDAAVVPFPPKG